MTQMDTDKMFAFILYDRMGRNENIKEYIYILYREKGVIAFTYYTRNSLKCFTSAQQDTANTSC